MRASRLGPARAGVCRAWCGLLWGLLWALWVLAAPTARAAQDLRTATAPAPATALPPGVALPVQVGLAVQILNLTELHEVAGTLRLQLETRQRWRDPRLAFDPLREGRHRLDRQDEAAQRYLAGIWTPGLVLENQLEPPTSRTVAVSTHADGVVELVERYESRLRVTLDLAAFPFDRQALALDFALPRHARQAVVLVSTGLDRRASGVAPRLSLAQWRPTGLRFAHGQASGWNAAPHARLTATLALERDAASYLLRVFVPLVAVLSVSVFVLWVPGLAPKDEGSLIFSSLLALTALGFTFESSFPGAVSQDTPVAQILSLGYAYLVAVLLARTVLGRLMPPGPRAALARAWLDELRWLLPLLMALVGTGAVLRTLPLG
ncbi:neurotransmitter-gated ion-channel ligand-binding protein [Ideonella livida]|uniref:Neurotransmitter-gated ion-channel ligand-binding protein n=1 Tax=Ideonella livida TaxID=2707176 RepID=A0A7C9TNH6_9BURK|nr:neurotransmitter-gated ion-channel ligand-binding protein [Ideonella livida]NDY93485.1 neurotransmitter-gated ion-channel ligand-binding protein [Ideonella livida]